MIAERLRERARVETADPLLRSAYSLMANGTVTAGLGLVFWIVAARLYSADDIGRDAALIAAMMQLGVIALLNLNNAMTRFLPSLERGAGRALLTAYAASGAAALVVGALFVAVAPLTSDEFGFLRDDWIIAVLFVFAQVMWTWFILQDAALTAVRRAPWVLIDNTVFGVLKLAALPLFAAVGAAHGVLLAWVLPVVITLIPINYLLFRRFIAAHIRTTRPSGSRLARLGRRRLIRFVAQDYGASVLDHLAMAMLPLIVVASLGSSANAYFYIPFMIVLVFDQLFYAVGRSLVVEGALAEDQIRALAVKVTRRFVAFLIPGVLVLVAAAPLILLPFGDDYVREGVPVLRVLAAGCIFEAVAALYMSIARLHGQGLRILAVQSGLTALLLAGAIVLADPVGLIGVALAWLGSRAIVALAILPSLVRFLRSSDEDEIAGERIVATPSEEVALP